MKLKFLIVGLFLSVLSCQVPNDSTNPQQSENTSPSASSEPKKPESNKSLAGLPANIQDYTQWLKMNTEPIPPDSGAPHTPSGGLKNVFVSNNVKPSVFPYPDGTLIVKEALHKTDGFVELIAVMRKEKGVDPEHGDWVFDEYIRSDAKEPFRLAFKGSICWGCHSKAKETDWSFTQVIN